MMDDKVTAPEFPAATTPFRWLIASVRGVSVGDHPLTRARWRFAWAPIPIYSMGRSYVGPVVRRVWLRWVFEVELLTPSIQGRTHRAFDGVNRVPDHNI
jgi:hypothetical protein